MNRWELPEGWEWTTIGAVGEVRLGRQRTPEHHSGPNMRPYLRVANVHEGRIDTSDVKEMNFTDAEFEIFKLREGDVLLNEGQSKEFVGRPAIFKGEVPGACFQNTLVRFRASKDVNPEYAYQLFRHYMHAGHFQEIAKITTSIAHLGGDRFASRPFPLPPLQEQTRIAERLNALQARITTARAGLDELRQLATALKRAVLDAAFRGDLTATWREAHPDTEPASALLDRLRAERRRRWQEAHPKKPYIAPEPVDPTDLPELPEGWCWAALEEITDFVTSGSRGWAEHYSDDGALFIRVGNLDRDTISLDLSERTHVRPPVGAEGDRTRLVAGDILVSITADVGMVGLIPEGIGEAYVNQHVAMIRPVPGVRPAILAWGLLNPHGAGPIINESHYGMTKASLSLPQVRRLPVALPPEGEHQLLVDAIAGSLATAERVSEATHELSDDLTTTEHALLTAAFRGELLPPAAP